MNSYPKLKGEYFLVNTPQQEVIRRKLVEARQNTWFREGQRIYGFGSPITYRLLQFPSTSFRYTGIILLDSGTWRTQKIIEVLTKEDIHLWAGVVSFRAPHYIQAKTLETMRVFLESAFRAQPRLFLDIDTGFWNEEMPEWLLTYRSTSFIEQHTAEGMITRKGNPVCYITVEGSAIQP